MVKKQWEKIRTYLIAFLEKIKNKQEHEDNNEEAKVHSTLALDPAVYKELKELAQLEKTTVSAIVYRAIEYYKEKQVSTDEWQIELNRKEKNPLLLLDGIAISIEQMEKKEEREEEDHESRSPVNW